MAGNIPPLVSSTPPPLNAFDDDDEEEEDEFGLYNAAEDIDCNECISFKENDEEKQNVSKSRGEQDSTSQDSATDSGLCPDSEEMSPTPHSDEERTLKQNSCDKLCQNTGKQPQDCGSEPSECQKTISVNLNSVTHQNLSNGHTKEDNFEQESDDDFGNFEFASSHRIHTAMEETIGEGVLRTPSPSNIQQYNEAEHSSNNHSHTEQISEKMENTGIRSSEFSLVESNVNGLVVNDTEHTPAIEETCKYEQSNAQFNDFTTGKLDIASSNDSSSFNSVDLSLEPKDETSSQYPKIEQHDFTNLETTTKQDNEDCLKATMENFEYREEKEILDENGDDNEFDDFTDFKAEFPECDNLPKSEQSDELNEHSKIFMEKTQLGEVALSLPILHQEESDDEFSNFADFSSSDCAFVSAQSSNSLENVSHIPLKLDDSDLRTESEFQDWVSVFPCEDDDTPLVATALLRQDDVVWSRLFPLESSPALSYQWNESLSNRRLLTALNIDSRNILFTPWSISAVPRFAANLSCGPLEPIKATEPLQPSAAPPSTTTTIPANNIAPTVSNTTSTTTQDLVPDAHFDWVSSGLTNPLDCPKTVLNLPKILSAEAENILSLLPDISFMRKTYIDFPISEA